MGDNPVSSRARVVLPAPFFTEQCRDPGRHGQGCTVKQLRCVAVAETKVFHSQMAEAAVHRRKMRTRVVVADVAQPVSAPELWIGQQAEITPRQPGAHGP